MTSMFAAVCQEACGKNRGEVHYMATVSTPGGINMQALELLGKAGAFEAWPGGAEADYGAYGGGYSQAFRPLTRSLSKIP